MNLSNSVPSHPLLASCLLHFSLFSILNIHPHTCVQEGFIEAHVSNSVEELQKGR